MKREGNVTLHTEIRHLPCEVIQHLARSLDESGLWRVVARKIPFSATDPSPLYLPQHLRIMETGRDGPSMTLLKDWGIHGRKRPTVDYFIEILTECEIYRLADYLSVDILKGEPVVRNFISTTVELQRLELTEKYEHGNSFPVGDRRKPAQADSHFSIPDRSDVDGCVGGLHSRIMNTDASEGSCTFVSALWTKDYLSNITHLDYEYLQKVTDNFNEAKLKDGGRKIGTGAFSDVFLAIDAGVKVAVKRLKKDLKNELFKEVNILASLRHKNFIELRAISVGNEYSCLIYEYMENGSLQDRLARLDNTPPLSWERRLTIASEIAEGLVCLHSHGFVHRDVKSANVLLDGNLNAKLGDFGIAHVGPDLSVDTSLETARVIGTSVYMPKEAFHGIITFKLDTYSFGVVLLELLTGMKPCDPKTKDDLVNYVTVKYSKTKDVKTLLDPLAGNWNIDIATQVFNLSFKCLETAQSLRPAMTEMVYQFQTLALNARQCVSEALEMR